MSAELDTAAILASSSAMPTPTNTSTLTGAELAVLKDAVDAYETVAEDAVQESGEKPASYLKTYRRLRAKVSRL